MVVHSGTSDDWFGWRLQFSGYVPSEQPAERLQLGIGDSGLLNESRENDIIKTAIPDILLLDPSVFSNEHGFFFESYNQKQFEEAVGYPVTIVQDHHSRSSKGVLRGLHYQLPPHAQGKLVRCIAGKVFDVAVDTRQRSPTFGI